MADGTLVFDTRIDSSNISDYFKEIDREYGVVGRSTKELKTEIKRLEAEYGRLKQVMEFAVEAGLEFSDITKDIKKVGAELNDVRAELDAVTASEKQFQVHGHEAMSEVTENVKTLGSHFAGLGKTIIRSARSIFVLSVLSTSLRDITSASFKVFPQLKALETSFNALKVAVVRAAGPLINILVPAFNAVIEGITMMVNTLHNAIQGMVSFFGGKTSDDVGVTARAVSAFGENAEKAGKGVAKSTKSMAQFDKIMQLQKKDIGASAAAAKQAAATLPQLSKVHELLKQLGPLLAGYLIGGPKGAGLVGLLMGTAEAFNAALDQWRKGVNWDNFSQLLVGGLKASLGAAALFGKKGAALVALIIGTVGAFNAALDQWRKGVNGDNFFQLIVSGLTAAAAAGALFGIKGAALVALIIGTVASFNAALDQWRKGISWGNFLQLLGAGLTAAIAARAFFGKKGASLVTLFIGTVGAFNAALDQWNKGINWANFTQTIASNLAITWGIFQTFGAKAGVITVGILGLKDAILAVKDIIENGLNPQNFVQAMTAIIEITASLSKLLGGSTVVNGVAIFGIIGFLGEMIKSFNNIASGSGTWHDALILIASAIGAVGSALALIVKGNPIGFIIAGVSALVVGLTELVKHWDWVKDKLLKAWDIIKEAWNKLVAAIKSGFGSTLGKVWDKLFGKSSTLNVSYSKFPEVPGSAMLGNVLAANGGLRVPTMATGSILPASFGSFAGTSDSSGSSNPISVATLTEAFTRALQNSGLGNAIVEVDGRAFGSLVYEYGNREGARIGNNLIISN